MPKMYKSESLICHSYTYILKLNGSVYSAEKHVTKNLYNYCIIIIIVFIIMNNVVQIKRL